MTECKICHNRSDNKLHTARELAYGLGDSFTYLECGQCGCVQLVDIPADLGKYYPGGYYSHQPQGKLKTFVRHRWSAHAFGRRNVVGWAVSKAYGPRRSMLAVVRARPEKTARILDVGCGSGPLLLDLAWLGFKNLSGADPFLPRDVSYPNGVTAFKRQLSEMPGPFDLIMMHHSFEHMDEPAAVMRQAAERLLRGGQLILGIPVASSFAWKNFGVNWVGLDAPRHLYLHTSKSIELLAVQGGLVIEQVVHEGDYGQFCFSEQYAKGIPLHDPRSFDMNFPKMLWHWRYLRACAARADEINRKGEADLVCFHLRKPA